MTTPSQMQTDIALMKVRMDKYDDILETMRIQAGKTDILIEEMQKRSSILETAIGKLGDSLIPNTLNKPLKLRRTWQDSNPPI